MDCRASLLGVLAMLASLSGGLNGTGTTLLAVKAVPEGDNRKANLVAADLVALLKSKAIKRHKTENNVWVYCVKSSEKS